MRRIKQICFGLFAVAALAVTIGVGTASADTFCKANEDPCSKGNRYPETAELVRSEALEFCLFGCVKANIVWEESTFEDVGPGEGLKGTIKAASFSGVKGECSEAEALNLPWAAEWTASTQRLNFSSGGSGNPGLRLRGCLGVNAECRYSPGATSLWAVVGGNPLKLHELGDVWSKTGGSPLCPATGTWSSEGQLTKPTGLLHLVNSP
jgi:hypothetical protein